MKQRCQRETEGRKNDKGGTGKEAQSGKEEAVREGEANKYIRQKKTKKGSWYNEVQKKKKIVAIVQSPLRLQYMVLTGQLLRAVSTSVKGSCVWHQFYPTEQAGAENKLTGQGNPA